MRTTLVLVVTTALVGCPPAPTRDTAAHVHADAMTFDGQPGNDAQPALDAQGLLVDGGIAALVDATIAVAPTSSDASVDAKAMAKARPARCAATFSAQSGAVCFMEDFTCAYPEGTCFCVPPAQCGGAARPPSPGDRSRSDCMPNDPSRLRLDGCQYGVPADGGPCGPDGRVCRYGRCAWSEITATCTQGKWNVSHHGGPPPP